ncbi:MAG: hypothetical protein U0414_38200 [Polyangiaceae bacterium]
MTSVSCRRYLCTCGWVMLVVPCEISGWRRYTLLALAFLRFGDGVSTRAIRKEISPGATFEDGWPSIRRWCKAFAEGRLFRWIRGVSELVPRAVARHVAVAIAGDSGHDSRTHSLEERVVAGVMALSRH